MAFIPKIDPEFVKKNPFVYAYIVLFVILGFFISAYVETNKGRNEDLIESRRQDNVQYMDIINELKSELKDSDSTNKELNKQTLIYQKAYDKISDKLDSLSRIKKKRWKSQ